MNGRLSPDSNGAYDNLERLDHIRKVMFAAWRAWSDRMMLDHQASRARIRRDTASSMTASSSSASTFRVEQQQGRRQGLHGKERPHAPGNAPPTTPSSERDAANIAWMHAASISPGSRRRPAS